MKRRRHTALKARIMPNGLRAVFPRSKRKLIPLLCDDSGVVWVPGFGVRDDGIAAEKRENLFVTLAIKNDEKSDGERLYSGSEFRT